MQRRTLYQRVSEQQRGQRAIAQVLQRFPCTAQMLRCDYTVRKHHGFIVGEQEYFTGINFFPGRQVEQGGFVMRCIHQAIAHIAHTEFAATLLNAQGK